MLKKLKKYFIKSSIDTVILLVILVILLFYIFNPVFIEIIGRLMKGYLGVNTAQFYRIPGSSLNIYHIFLIVALMVSLIFTMLLFTRSEECRTYYVFKKTVLSVFLFIIIIMGIFQAISFFNTLKFSGRRSGLYRNYNEALERASLINKKYDYCQSFRLETDLDLDRDPGMFTHRLYRYFLFPKGLHQEANCIFYLQKKNFHTAVPKNFILTEKISLVDGIAVRKDLIK